MSALVKIILALVVGLSLKLGCGGQILKKEAYLSVPQLISQAGYPAEKHRARTPDGYILQLHRIPSGMRTARRSGEPSAKGKRAVLIVHGWLRSSCDFVIMGPQRSLAYYLADAGYDVWLGNLRGNLYTTHENLTRNNTKFWDYSFDEHGKYDVPAMIDRILNVTGLQKLLYVGYSMGTTSFFTMMSQRPEYNEKVVAFVALAPAVYLDNIRPLATTFLKTINVPQWTKALVLHKNLVLVVSREVMRSRGLISTTFRPEVLEFLVGSVCSVEDPQQDICMRFLFTIVGEDFEQIDWDMAPVIIARFHPGSWRQFEHIGKIALTGVFTSWEDGLWGKVKPFKLSNVKVPITLLYGENDQLTEKSQIMKLANELNSTGMLEEVRLACNWPKFQHLDFMFAKDVGSLLNKPLVELINKLYNKYGLM